MFIARFPNPLAHEYGYVIRYGRSRSLKDRAWKYMYYFILDKKRLDADIICRKLREVIEKGKYDLNVIDNLIGALLLLFITKELGNYDDDLGKVIIDKALRLRRKVIVRLTPRIPLYELDFALTLVTDNQVFEESLKKSNNLISHTYYFIARFLKYGPKDYEEVMDFLRSVKEDIKKSSIEECGLLLILIGLYGTGKNKDVSVIIDRIMKRLYRLSPPHIVSDIPVELAYKVVLGLRKTGLHRIHAIPLKYVNELKRLIRLIGMGYEVIEKGKISVIKVITGTSLVVLSSALGIIGLNQIIHIPNFWISCILVFMLLLSISVLACIHYLLPRKG